jgi:tRNA-specific 2-thiouridylase
MAEKEAIRALGLLSGGLDSQLAICVLRSQGIEVEVIVFDSPFYNPAAAKKAAKNLDVPLRVIDFTDDIVELVNNPPHGFGGNMNPCIDCHARMLKRAGEIMVAEGFHFLFTGEVLNQRPMSQNRRSLGIVSHDSEFDDLVVRPLCAQLLEPTKPEREGWVDRSRLLSLNGRSRKPQFALAEEYGLKEYPSPAGGCRLTEPHYSERLADLKAHEGLDDSRALTLLRFGRHFRLGDRIKLIVGRHAEDCAHIEELIVADTDLVLTLADGPGPTGLLPSGASEAEVAAAASILVRYTRVPADATVRVRVAYGDSEKSIEVSAMAEADAEALRIGTA